MSRRPSPPKLAPSITPLATGSGALQQLRQQIPIEGSRRTKVSLACNECKNKKTRCDGARPQCSACTAAGIKCVYEHTDRRRREVREQHTQTLRHQIHQLQLALQSMRTRYGVDDNEDAHLMTEVVEESPVAISPRSPSTANAGPSRLLEGGARPPLSEGFVNDNTAMLTSEVGTAENPGSKERAGQGNEPSPPLEFGYHLRNLPPQDVVRGTVDCFFDGTSSLFFITTEDRVDGLLEIVYGDAEGDFLLALHELCAVAALGSYYMLSAAPSGFRQACFRTALMNVFYCIEYDASVGIRVVICLCLATVLEKRVSARVLIAAGLEIARRHKLEAKDQVTDRDAEISWPRLLRTLLMIDSWLSFTTRTPPCSPDILGASGSLSIAVVLSVDDSIQSHISLLAHLICQGVSDVLANGHGNLDVASKHLLRLESWHKSLPEYMRLPSLMSQNQTQMSRVQRRSILLLHLMHLGGLLLIQAPLVLKVARDALDYTVEDEKLDAQARAQYINCFVAAQSAARITALLPPEGNIKRCWIVIYNSYCAGVVLLYKAWLDFINKKLHNLEQSLAYLKTCTDMLKWCSTDDKIAKDNYDRLEVEGNQLKGAMADAVVASPEPIEAKQALWSLIGDIPDKIDPAVENEPFQTRLIKLLEEACGTQTTIRKESVADATMEIETEVG